MRISIQGRDRQHRSASARVVALCLVASALVAAPAEAVTATGRVTLGGNVDAVAGRPDGSLRVTARRRIGDRFATVVSTLRLDGATHAGVTLWTTPLANPRHPRTAITDDGAVAVVEQPARPGRLRSLEAVTLVGERRSAVQRISAPWGTAGEPEITVGGKAAGVLFAQHRPHERRRLMWAYKPAGSARFTTARPVTEAGRDRKFRYVTALGRRGSGAIFETSILPVGETPPFRLRRLGSDGSVGPWITVSDEGFEDGAGQLAIAPDGTVVIVFWAHRPVAEGFETALIATTLPPGASTVTPPQRLLSLRNSVEQGIALPDFDFSLAVGPRGQTAIATVLDSDSGEMKLFTGSARALQLTGDFRVAGIDPPHLITVTRDGGVTAVWAPNDSFVAPPNVATHKPLGGRFSQPSVVARSRSKGESQLMPIFLSPTRDGSALFGYLDEDFRDEISRVVTLEP